MIHTILFAAPLLAAQVSGPFTEWKFDEITLVNGAILSGMILDDNSTVVRFQVVNRRPGRPAVTFTTTLFRAEIANVKKLSEIDRSVLRDRVAGLDPAGVGEQQRMAELELRPADWLGQPAAAKRYDSDHFVLISSAPEEITRRAAVRLEQIYMAYTRFLPPRTAAARPTTILLAPDSDEYQALVGPILNPAVFDPEANRIVLRTNLRQLGGELKKTRLHNSQQLAALDKYEADLRKLYRQRELERYLEYVERERKRVRAAERANDAIFDQATREPFALLYHETFHAYVGNFVYSPGTEPGELPRWMNEGLAQIFETAVLEAGELRVGHADPERIKRAQALAAQGKLVPIRDLLQVGRDAFVALHADQKSVADRTYLTAWAVGFHLAFQKRILGTTEFDKYLAALNDGTNPLTAFAELVQQDVEDYEKTLYIYIKHLMPDGSVRK
jgi:hypothetical protein